jgi:hypothetical protein
MEIIVEVKPERAYELIEEFATWIVKKNMGSAGILFIESLRPLNFIASQAMYVILPVAEIFFSAKKYQEFAVLLEDQKYVNHLIKRIDELEEEHSAERRKQSRERRERRRNKIKYFFKTLLRK